MAWSEKQPLLGRVVGPPQIRVPLCAILSVVVMPAFGMKFCNYQTPIIDYVPAGSPEHVLEVPWSWYDVRSPSETY